MELTEKELRIMDIDKLKDLSQMYWDKVRRIDAMIKYRETFDGVE